MNKDKRYLPNGTEEEIKLGILHNVGGFWVSNQGTKEKPKFCVWVTGCTHSVCDSAYEDITLAVGRCNYLHKNYPTTISHIKLAFKLTLSNQRNRTVITG
jgi:hypothetical protein